MDTNEVCLSRVINAPIGRVWEVLTDIDGAAETLSGVDEVERLDGDGYAVGVRWRETRTMLGMRATEEMCVAEVSAPTRTVVTAASHGMEYTTVFRLHPGDVGTLLEWRFFARQCSTSVAARVVCFLTAPLGRRVTRMMMRRDLDDIAARAEKLAIT